MFDTPGVYIQEPPSFPPSIVPVATAIPVFIGFTQKNPNPDGNPQQAVKIFNLQQFEDLFGSIDHRNDFTCTIEYDSTKESISYNIETVDTENVYNYNLYHALRLYFDNGGGDCFVISLGTHAVNNDGDGNPDPENPNTTKPLTSITNDSIEAALTALENEDDPTLIVFPEIAYTASITDEGQGSQSLSYGLYQKAYNDSLIQAIERKDRFVIMDIPMLHAIGIPQTIADNDVSAFRENVNLDFDSLKFGAAYYPYLTTSVNAIALSTTVEEENGIEVEKINIEVTVSVDGTEFIETGETEPKYAILSDLKGDNRYGAVYQKIIGELSNMPFQIPPSAAMAGIYAKVDDQRGVFKAPANVTVASVTKPNLKINDGTQAGMNVHTSGKAVNAIRTITDRGLVVWGARTLDANNLDFRYINVRRFFNFVEESVKKSMYRFVFEPNDGNTWARIRAAIENFLTDQWEAGALQGAKADDAFRVFVGLGQTMDANDILEGRLKVRIEMAIVRPAEFIILEFVQILPTS